LLVRSLALLPLVRRLPLWSLDGRMRGGSEGRVRPHLLSGGVLLRLRRAR